MLRLVVDREVPVGELATRSGLSQPAASQHLRVLRDAGLVDVRVEGPRRLYRASPDGLARLRSEIEGFWRPNLEALKRAAAEDAGSAP
jgi:DNA-binding transcriptional ArsR family regulator